MSFWKANGKNIRSIDNFGLSTTQTVSGNQSKEEFYELELGVVLDIILDEKHPIFSEKSPVNHTVDANNWPSDLEGNSALSTDPDLTWIGRVLVRPLTSQPTVTKDKLVWAYPLEANLSEYPILNEMVILVRYLDKLFYSRKLNIKNLPHNNVDFGVEQSVSGTPNSELYSNPTIPYNGPQSITKHKGGPNYSGAAGKYLIINNKIRSVKRFEGDFVIESRFGQSFHMTAYDSNRKNDVGDDSKSADYINGGNPMILIRNRQRPLIKAGGVLELGNSPNKASVIGTEQEKNAGGYLEEDINHDGSSIHITCGQTISKWVTTCYKKMFGTGEEVPGFNGKIDYKYPILNGDQIVINTDRLILSARYGEMFHYSKKRYSIVTDTDYTLDAHQQIVLTSNTKTVINSPAIYLGEYDMTNEPALLGQTTVNWLYEMCNWMLEHTHWYKHSHVDAGKESPSQTQLPVQVQKLIALRDKLHTLMSRRVFLTGGGLSPGRNGGNITDGSPPTNINIANGNGVPGGWNGTNYRRG